MKLFWAVIVVFVAAAAYLVFAQPRKDVAPEKLVAADVPHDLHDSQDARPSTSSLFDPVEVGDNDLEPNSEVTVIDEPAQQLADDLYLASLQPRTAVGENADDNAPAGHPWETDPASSPIGAPAHEHQQIQSAENPWAVEGEFALGDERLAAQRLEHSVEKQDDGSLLLDGTFVIHGDGSAQRPYEITWDLLMSAAETYQPRLGMREIPKRIALLDDKHVRISGYLMFPMVTGQADELLIMLNMWDGCCIGTMPSPYDAAEVQLAEPVAGGRQQFFNYGTIEGKFSVDPYLMNDWLIGLYVIEDAKLEVGM